MDSSPTDFKRNKEYSNTKLILSICSMVINVVFFTVLVFTGASVHLKEFASHFTGSPYLVLLIFAFSAGVIETALTGPVSFYSGFVIEHKYGLSNQTVFAWLKDELKGAVIGTVIFVPVLLLFYYILLHYPDSWWLYMGIVLFLLSIVFAQIAPVVLFPLFYKFSPLENEELLDKMKALLDRAGLRIKGIYSFDMSKDTKKANAALAGLGATRRVILGDTLLSNFSTDEIVSVFAHEAGHHHHKHMFKQILFGTITLFGSLFVTSVIYKYVVTLRGFEGIGDIAALPAITLIYSILSLIISPLQNYLSQSFEFQADRYAFGFSGGGTFAGAMEKLRDLNLADPDPHPFISLFFHSHPSISRRIAKAEEFDDNSRENPDN